MKRIISSVLALVLVCMLVLPVMPKAQAKIIIGDDPDVVIDTNFSVKPSTPGTPSNPGSSTKPTVPGQSTTANVTASTFNPRSLVKGPLKMLASRAVQELSAYCISNDVPGFSTFFKLMMTPAQRAASAQQQNIATIMADVAEIKASVAQIESQLQDVSDKLDKYATAAAFNQAAQSFRDITGKYAAVWDTYSNIFAATEEYAAERDILNEYKAILDELKRLEESIAAETDEAKLAQLQAELDACRADMAAKGYTQAELEKFVTDQAAYVQTLDNKIEMTMDLFISQCEEGGGLSFAADLTALTEIIWSSANPTGSYLGAYEAFLRERYGMEHEIAPALYEAFNSAVSAQVQILSIYTEYYTQKKNVDSETYKVYTEDYFADVHAKIISNCNAIAELSGFDKLMVAEPYTEEELAEFRKNDMEFVPPEHIRQTVTIGGKTYNCYKVRDNKDLNYYIIVTDFLSGKDHVRKFSPVYAISSISDDNMLDVSDKHIYRPKFTFDNQYTDDRFYQLVDVNSIPAFLTGDGILSSTLRTTAGLTQIPQDTKYILFYSTEIKNHSSFAVHKFDVYWNMKFMDINKTGRDDLLSVSSVDVYNSDDYGKSLMIYRLQVTDEYYMGENNTWQVVDKGDITGRTVTVRNGQTLDLSNVTVNVDDVTIYVLGEATIISNPNITLTNSAIIVATDKPVTIQDVKLQGKIHRDGAIETTCNANITFKGNNSFTARSEKLTGLKLYEFYVPGKPVFASHGMYVAKGTTANITISGQSTFQGTHGGAGICTDGSVNITGGSTKDKLIAIGSALVDEENDIGSELYGYYAPAGVGAGIGASYSTMIREGRLDGFDYDLVGDKGKINITNLTVDARGSHPGFYGNLRGEDIGGILEDKETYAHVGGTIKNSVIIAKRHQVSANITTKLVGNTFQPDEYTFEVSTNGTNAVTTDGLWFNVIGVNGTESGWMHAEDVGNDKGTTTQTVIGNSVGEILAVKVKTDSDNHWYANYVKITAKYSGESATIYGGRWIGNTEKTLSIKDNVYCLTITTSNDKNAGTDANISVFLQDNKGKVTNTIDLSDIHYESNAFEKGDEEAFYIYAPDDFGECCHVFLTSDHANSAAGWKVEKIAVEKKQGGTDGYTIVPDYWFEYASTVNFGKYPGKTGAYRIDVQTGDVSKAGTDSDISITIHGDAYSKNTPKINMSDIAGGGFERNDLDTFAIGFNVNGIGDVKSITIEKNNAGTGPDWYLTTIWLTEIVANGQTGRVYTFKYNDWINNESVDINVASSQPLKSATYIDREILSNLEILEDGTYQLTADRCVTVSKEIMALLMETGTKLTIIMTHEGKTLYSVSFDGTQIGEAYSVTLPKGHGFAEGNANLDLLSGNPLPDGTVVHIYPENLGFRDSDKLVLWSKTEMGLWVEESNLVIEDGLVRIPLQDGKELLISKQDADLPSDEIPETGDAMLFAVIPLIIAVVMLVVLTHKKRINE